MFYLGTLIKHNDLKLASGLKLKSPGVSVIIAAKNEADNLSKHLKQILDQDYPEFEVIIINDHSKDDTREMLNKLEHPRLKTYDLQEGTGKKRAIALGVDKSKYDYLLFTDADCLPNSEAWIRKMIQPFDQQVKIVLGHGRFYPEKGILNSFIRYENLVNACQYFAFALKGIAYMGVGRNLAYSKDLFYQSKAFHQYGAILSGDDDLIVNEMANETNVAICMDEEGHTISKAKRTWKDYIHQKRRQLQAGNFYKSSDRARLAFWGLNHLVFNISTLILLIFCSNKLLFLSIFVVKWMIQVLYLNNICKKMRDSTILPFIGILEFFYYIIISLIGVSTWIWKVKKWQ